ncbi:MAG: pyruvate kinase [Chitinivibrionales bacterium]|nr:pyruvate kinase [Chitinivibrionales bacterium]
MDFSIKKAKIVATLGPASRSKKQIRLLLGKGADVFRINFSHGTHDDHRETLENIAQAGIGLKKHPGILADLQGPKIRTGKTESDSSVVLINGRSVLIRPGKGLCNADTIYVDYPALIDDVKAGQHILINDGAIELTVKKVDIKENALHCKILNTGTYSSRKGVNLPDSELSIPSMTPKDRRDLKFILEKEVHYIALSFVRMAEDLTEVNNAVKRSKKPIKVLAKIEKPEAAERVDDILNVCDGIMVARGDLGVETSPQEVPILQKHLITRANEMGKLVIVATQMLESMINSPRPTRAEAADVANAVLDRTDALMLSGETAVGSYPAKTVTMMERIISTTEKSTYYPRDITDLSLKYRYPPYALCEAAAWAGKDLDNVPVLVFTVSGNTALYLSKIRTQSHIFGFSPDPAVVSLLALAWNVTPFLIDFDKNIVSLQKKAEQILLKSKCVKKNDLVLVLSGTTPARGATNFLRVKKVGEL